MSSNLDRRLQRIKESLSEGHADLWNMTDDELAQVITGNPRTKASALTTEYLESVARRQVDEDGT
jgi:predicted mannosyl-3-phosphoglycerate phosphatase (HAD superfamily)